MLPPANRQIAAKRLAIVEIRADDRSLKVYARLHLWRRVVRFRASITLHRRFVDWLQAHDPFLKIEDYAELTQEISAQNSALLESSRFIHRFQIENRGVNFFSRVSSNRQFWQQ